TSEYEADVRQARTGERTQENVEALARGQRADTQEEPPWWQPVLDRWWQLADTEGRDHDLSPVDTMALERRGSRFGIGDEDGDVRERLQAGPLLGHRPSRMELRMVQGNKIVDRCD